jgi:predicted RNA-binding protein YlqC (UPF0109 family)
MIVDFVTEYIRLIVNYPSDISVEKQSLSKDLVQITINANNADIGKIIGKNGNMINSIKTMVNGCKAKDGISYKLQVQSI